MAFRRLARRDLRNWSVGDGAEELDRGARRVVAETTFSAGCLCNFCK